MKNKTELGNEIPKLTDWKNEPTVSDLKSDYTSAKSSKDTQVAKIDDWVDMLNIEGRHKPTKTKGRSAVQPKLVRKQAEWRYSALSEPFLNSENVFSIAPKTHMDREAAYQNELVLNYQFNNQIDRVKLIDTYVRTAVNQGTVIARIGWLYEEATVTEDEPVYEYVDVSEPQEAQFIMQAVQLQATNPNEFKMLPVDLQQSVEATVINGRPIKAIITDYEQVEVIKTVRNQPDITICDYHNITIDPTCNGIPDKANFIIYSFETSKSELSKAGHYKNLDKIVLSDPLSTDHYTTDTGFRFQDKARKKLVAYEYWGYWDIDDSGKTTPIVATWVGDVMIRLEVNPFPDRKLPFVVIPYLPVENSVYGEPDAALLEENQRIVGALTRGMVDSMARSANAQIGMRKDALDSVNKRKFNDGLDYEFNPTVDPRMAIIEHSYPELPSSTFGMLQLFNMEAEAITGVKSFTGGLSGDALGSTATGVRGLLDAASKRELNILRRLSQGLQDIAKKILAMNAEWLSDEEVIRLTDEDFVKINRDNLLGSFDIKLSISNTESDNIKAQELSFMLQTMGQSLPFDMTKTILSEIAKLRNMPDLSKIIQQYEPQPDPRQELEVQNLQLENQKLQAELQETMVSIQLKQAQIERELAHARKLSTDANLNDLDFVEQESGVKQARDLEKQQAQAAGNVKRDILNNVLNSKLKGNTSNV